MNQVVGDLGNLIEGLTERPRLQKNKNKLLKMNNFIPDLTKGLKRRPGTKRFKTDIIQEPFLGRKYFKYQNFIFCVYQALDKSFKLDILEYKENSLKRVPLKDQAKEYSFPGATELRDIGLKIIRGRFYVFSRKQKVQLLPLEPQKGPSVILLKVDSLDLSGRYGIRVHYSNKHSPRDSVDGAGDPIKVYDTGSWSSARGWIRPEYDEKDPIPVHPGELTIPQELHDLLLQETSKILLNNNNSLTILPEHSHIATEDIILPDGTEVLAGESYTHETHPEPFSKQTAVFPPELYSHSQNTLAFNTAIEFEAGVNNGIKTYTLDNKVIKEYNKVDNPKATAQNLRITDIEFITSAPSDFSIITDNIKDIQDLPSISLKDHFLEVSTEDKSFKPYYLRFKAHDPDAEGITSGIWKEDTKEPEQIDPSTLPHEIKIHDISARFLSELTHEYTIEPISVNPRTVGDNDTNKTPKFVDDYIQDIHLFQNRLCVLCGTSLSFSRVHDLFNFYRESATILSNADSTYLLPETYGGNLSFMFEFKYLWLFSEDGNLYRTDDQVITPVTGNLVKDMEINIDPNFLTFQYKIQQKENTFLVPDYTYQGNRILEVNPTTDFNTKAIYDITIEVPSLIKGRIRDILLAKTFNTMFITSDQADQRHRIFVNSYLYDRDDLKYSAWYTFSFNKKRIKIDYIFMDHNSLKILYIYQGKQELLALDLFTTEDQVFLDYSTIDDLRISEDVYSYSPPGLLGKAPEVIISNIEKYPGAKDREKDRLYLEKVDREYRIPENDKKWLVENYKSFRLTSGYEYLSQAELPAPLIQARDTRDGMTHLMVSYYYILANQAEYRVRLGDKVYHWNPLFKGHKELKDTDMFIIPNHEFNLRLILESESVEELLISRIQFMGTVIQPNQLLGTA